MAFMSFKNGIQSHFINFLQRSIRSMGNCVEVSGDIPKDGMFIVDP